MVCGDMPGESSPRRRPGLCPFPSQTGRAASLRTVDHDLEGFGDIALIVADPPNGRLALWAIGCKRLRRVWRVE